MEDADTALEKPRASVGDRRFPHSVTRVMGRAGVSRRKISMLKQATVISYLAFYAGFSPSFKTFIRSWNSHG